MDLYELKLFRHLASTLHFGRTSQECHISPSALSRTIQRLEDELGYPLFERDNRTVKITRAGILFRDYAVQVLDRWENLKETLAEEGTELKGEISLYSSVTASLSILPEVMNRFRLQYPKVHLKLKTGDAASAVKYAGENDVDIAVAARPDQLPDNLLFRNLVETPLIFVCSKDDKETPEALFRGELDWSSVPMILSERGLARERIDDWFRRKGIVPQIYAEVSGNEAIISMVRLGCGIGVVPRLVMDSTPLKEHLVVLEAEPKLKPYSVGICLQKKRLKSPLVKAFWEIVVSFAQDSSDSGISSTSISSAGSSR